MGHEDVKKGSQFQSGRLGQGGKKEKEKKKAFYVHWHFQFDFECFNCCKADLFYPCFQTFNKVSYTHTCLV